MVYSDDTPLLSALEAYAARGAARFHMPGHKGRDVLAYDVTELPCTGDLYRARTDNPIRASEALFAKTYGFGSAVYLTGGASQGVFAVLAAYAGAGGAVLTDRLCHQSVCHAMALLDLKPGWLPRSFRVSDGVASPIDPALLERELSARKYAAVFVTSPTYNGVCSDIIALSDICARHGASLLVDAAHGAHLPFLPGDYGLTAADAVIISAHKTLPALGQAAAVLVGCRQQRLIGCGQSAAGGQGQSAGESVRSYAQMAGTSSPSYLIMASLESARVFLDARGREAGRELCGILDGFGGPLLLRQTPGVTVDPLRLTVRCRDGVEAAELLRARGVEPEAAAANTVILIVSLCEETSALERLRRALDALERERPDLILPPDGGETRTPALPESVMSVRDAFFRRDAVTLKFGNAVGMAAAKPFAPFPPGVAVLMPGERVGVQTAEAYHGVTHQFIKE